MKTLSVILCSIMSVSLFAASVYAASSYKVHDVTPQKQQGDSLCWAAVASMAAKTLGVSNATQENIVKAAYGIYADMSGTAHHAQKGLLAHGINSIALQSVPTFESIVYDINTNSTMLAFTRKKGEGYGHALLIRGYHSGSNFKNIYYIDPEEGTYHAKDYEYIKSNSDYEWVATVKNIKLL